LSVKINKKNCSLGAKIIQTKRNVKKKKHLDEPYMIGKKKKTMFVFLKLEGKTKNKKEE